MPESKSFFDDLPEEKVSGEMPVADPVEEPQMEAKPTEKDARDVALERKSTALSEERKKRKQLEERVKALEGAKVEKKEAKADNDDDEEEFVPPVTALNEEEMLNKLEKRRQEKEYSESTQTEIGNIARGAGKSKQWALKLKETVDSLPANLRSGNPETDVRAAIRFLESASSSGAFSMPSGSSALDIPYSAVPGGDSLSQLSENGRAFTKRKWTDLDDKKIDEYLRMPKKRLENGNVEIPLIR